METIVTDTNGISYKLGEEISSGGQGCVFRCANDARRAIKLYKDNNSKFELVRRLNLDKKVFIVPEVFLRDNNGYVMELLEDGMQSLNSIFCEPLKESGFSPNWYSKTGGLQKRYAVLAEISKALHYLHSNGMIYRDISLNNIFVSADPTKTSVCFIDCDNITYASQCSNQIGTPGFIPPEFFNGKSYGSLSEVFSFAVLAFSILRTQHPFKGSFFQNNPPEIVQEKYKNYLLPYIDATDPSNHLPYLFEEKNVFPEILQVMFHEIFESKLSIPMERKSISKWHEIFQNLQTRLLVCESCGNQYLLSMKECPWCKRPSHSKYLMMDIVINDGWANKYISDFLDHIGRSYASKEEKKEEKDEINEHLRKWRYKNRQSSIPFSIGQTKCFGSWELVGLEEDQNIEIKYSGKVLTLYNNTPYSLKEHGATHVIGPGQKRNIELSGTKPTQLKIVLPQDRNISIVFTERSSEVNHV